MVSLNELDVLFRFTFALDLNGNIFNECYFQIFSAPSNNSFGQINPCIGIFYFVKYFDIWNIFLYFNRSQKTLNVKQAYMLYILKMDFDLRS